VRAGARSNYFVDDGSTDGTRAAIRDLAGSAPIALIERDAPSLGLAGAVIAGARAATGEWLVVMDADLMAIRRKKSPSCWNRC